MRNKVLTIINVALFAYVVTLVPVACDTEYDIEHPDDVYISATDQAYIDIKDNSFED